MQLCTIFEVYTLFSSIGIVFFVVQLAALRIANYWNRRIELFGKNLAFKPLHLGESGVFSVIPGNDDGNDDDDDDRAIVKHTLKGLALGFIRPTQTHDSGGRAILFADPSRLAGYDKHSNVERMGVARAMWLVFHHVIEGDDMAQKLGKYFTVLLQFCIQVIISLIGNEISSSSNDRDSCYSVSTSRKNIHHRSQITKN